MATQIECEQILSIYELAAKSAPFQSIYTHSLVAGTIAQELIQQYIPGNVRELLSRTLSLDERETVRFAAYIASIHDIGKLAPQFQHRIAQDNEDLTRALRDAGMEPAVVSPHRVSHENSSSEIMQRIWTARRLDRASVRLFSGVVGAHHQRPPYTAAAEQPHGKPWTQLQEQLEAEMASSFQWNSHTLPSVDREKRGLIGALLNGLTILADWIASGEYFADAEQHVAEDGQKWIKERVERFLNVSELVQDVPPWGAGFDEVWPAFAGNARPLQRELELLLKSADDIPAVLLIEAPMGEGKTEAALYSATQLNRNGFYVALPTGATANQMSARVEQFLAEHAVSPDRHGVRLLHSMAWMHDSHEHILGSGEEEAADAVAARWLEPVRRGLLAPYAVGTVDQAMMAAMNIRYGVLRLLGLAGKVLIIDEIHAYDTYMDTILITLLTWCRALEIPVVLLSATLPPEKKAELLEPYAGKRAWDNISYPAITSVSWDGSVTVRPVDASSKAQVFEVVTRPILHDTEAIASTAVEEVSDGGCVCVLVNTVQQAQDVYEEIRRRADADCELQLFHSRFPAERRSAIEQTCIRSFGKEQSKRPQKAIIVATQVVEQSLDIDLDLLITSVAPIDLVLQRMGRVHRHADNDKVRPERMKKPRVLIMTPANDEWKSDAAVYPECLLRSSKEILTTTDSIAVPDDIPGLVQRGYSMEAAPADAVESWFERLLDESMYRAEGKKYVLDPPAKPFKPLTHNPIYDDLEDSGYLSARTRLGSPTARIALLEPTLYEEVRNSCARCSQKLAQQVLERSVSVPERMLAGYECDLRGSGRLTGTLIFRSVGDQYTSADGKTITYDSELGAIFKGGDE